VRASIDAGVMIGAFHGGRLVGSARYHLMRQWWHGRSMPMAGVAGVKVAPEERGRGAGTAMMTALLGQIGYRGFPVSVLFPTTAPLYRAAGWEIAGGWYETVLPARSLAALASPDWPSTAGTSTAGTGAAGTGLVGTGPALTGSPKLWRATPADAAAIVEVEGLVHERLLHCGPSTREPWMLRDWLDDEDRFAYLADDGFLSYRWADGTDEIDVEELVAASAATARAFWQILASHATMASRVRACLAPDDPVTWLTRDPAASTRQAHAWMLRVVDAPAAVAARGYPTAAVVSVRLDLTDAARPANSGRWVLEVSGGTGRLTRLGDAPTASHPTVLSLGARGFAALFAGVPVQTLRLAGLAAGGEAAADNALAAAFGGPAFMLDQF
jgi:hypothetical protein